MAPVASLSHGRGRGEEGGDGDAEHAGGGARGESGEAETMGREP